MNEFLDESLSITLLCFFAHVYGLLCCRVLRSLDTNFSIGAVKNSILLKFRILWIKFLRFKIVQSFTLKISIFRGSEYHVQIFSLWDLILNLVLAIAVKLKIPAFHCSDRSDPFFSEILWTPWVFICGQKYFCSFYVH